jgi:hypothetical protein
MSRRILFFSPYLPWIPHTLWEATLAYALGERGHTVQFVTCQGLPNCGVNPLRLYQSADRCRQCRTLAGEMLPNAGHRLEPMQTYLHPEEPAAISRWAESLPAETLRGAEYASLPLGEWVWPEMLNYWHSPEPDLTRPEVAQTYRDFLIGAATAAVCLPRAFDAHRPDILVTLNGAFFLHRVAVELALARGLRVITHERGLLDNTLTLNANAGVWDQGRFDRIWSAWKETPLTVEALRAVERLLSQRRRGQNMGWWAFSPSAQDLRQVRAAADLPDQPMALLCTSSECEASMAGRKASVGQQEWIEATIAWFAAHPENTLVIRVHPHEAEYAKVDDRMLRRYRALKAAAPPNVRLILPEEEVSTYSLMDMATAGLTYGSTTGLEMACQGLPLVHAGVGFYKGCGFTREVDSVADIPRLLAEVLAAPRSLETQRLAYRFAYHYFIGQSVPFRKVAVAEDFVQAEIAYESTAELAPGRDRELDRMVSYILGEAELYPPPSPLHALQSQDAEDRFFAEQRVAGLLEAARHAPERTDLLVHAASLLRDIGLVSDAIAVYHAALQRDPAAPDAWEGLVAAQSAWR